MYKNIIYFFTFPFITQNVWTGRVRESQRRLGGTYRCRGTNLQWTFFSSFTGRNLPGYITSWTPTQILVVTSPPACPPTHCSWECLLLACCPRNLRGVSAENTCVLFISGTRCFSCYFFRRIRLPQLHRRMSEGSSQYPVFTFFCCIVSTPFYWFCEKFSTCP